MGIWYALGQNPRRQGHRPRRVRRRLFLPVSPHCRDAREPPRLPSRPLLRRALRRNVNPAPPLDEFTDEPFDLKLHLPFPRRLRAPRSGLEILYDDGSKRRAMPAEMAQPWPFRPGPRRGPGEYRGPRVSFAGTSRPNSAGVRAPAARPGRRFRASRGRYNPTQLGGGGPQLETPEGTKWSKSVSLWDHV